MIVRAVACCARRPRSSRGSAPIAPLCASGPIAVGNPPFAGGTSAFHVQSFSPASSPGMLLADGLWPGTTIGWWPGPCARGRCLGWKTDQLQFPVSLQVCRAYPEKRHRGGRRSTAPVLCAGFWTIIFPANLSPDRTFFSASSSMFHSYAFFDTFASFTPSPKEEPQQSTHDSLSTRFLPMASLARFLGLGAANRWVLLGYW